jgi:HlyD family secretion protein
MKHLRFLFFFSILLMAACKDGTAPTPEPTVSVNGTADQVGLSTGNIRANGVLLPAQHMALSFGNGGFIQNVEVDVGQFVTAGQVLISLDPTEAKLALQRAEAELAAAQASYNLVTMGRPAEKDAAIAAAELELIAAQQALAAVHANADLAAAGSLQSLVDAQKTVDEAQRALDNIGAAPNQATKDAAYANMILARDRLDKAEDDYEPWRNKPENNTTRAALLSRLAEAQQVYDAAARKYNGYVGSYSDIDLAQAEAGLVLAQAQLADAEKTYALLKDGPDSDELVLAEARVADAQARLNLAESSGPTAEELALAQAQVDAARSSLEIIQSQIEDMVIVAPFDGLISVVEAREGERALPGATMVEVLDTSFWRIETRNVSELQIGKIALGGEVDVSVNAFKDEPLSGKIIAISPVAVVQQGDTTYTLTIELQPTDLNLWPGMTAQVVIRLD